MDWWRQRRNFLLRAVERRSRSSGRLSGRSIVFGILYFKLLLQYNEIGNNPQPCIANYLMKNEKIEANVGAFNGSKVLCSFYNVMLRFKIENEFRNALSEKKLHENEKNCLQNKADESLFAENLMKRILREEKLKTPEGRIVKIKEAIEDYSYQCKNLKIEHEYFNHVFESSKNLTVFQDEWKYVKDFCFKSYFLENQLIRSDFNLTPLSSPMNDDENFCYYNVIKPFKDIITSAFWKWMGIDQMLPLTHKICVINELEKSTVVDKLMAVSIGSCMGMTEDEKEIELKDFDMIYRQIIRGVHTNCVR